MPKKENEELTRHSLFLFAGDFDKLKELYPDVGAAFMVRRIIRQYILKIESKVEGETPETEIDI